MKKRKLWKILGTALVIVITLVLLQELLMPKYIFDITEGAMIREYYGEEKDHDVIFIGDCEVYENFSPVVLWQEYGINSYIRGSAQQLIWQSYYLLEDTLRYETPDVVVFNVLALQYDKPQSEAYNRMTLEGMRWSGSKVKSILASMTEEESFLEYVFPILRYHSRWSELKAEDVKGMFQRERVTHNGYYMRVDVRPAENVPEGRILADYSFGENAWAYMDKIVDLCQESGIRLVLVKAPSLYPYWYPQWEEQVEAYAVAHELPYINFLELTEETGLDFSRDTYDAGLHLNLSGAEKISRYFGEYLQDELGLADRRGESRLAERWQEKIAVYEQDRDAQYEEYGMLP